MLNFSNIFRVSRMFGKGAVVSRRLYALGLLRIRLLQTQVLENSFPVKSIIITSGQQLFAKRRQKQGHQFDIKYVDEHKLNTSKANSPVVVMLHGAPGSHLDFQTQIKFMFDQGTRVLIPNFPDLPTVLKYRSPKFRNTPLNKATLVQDFLLALGIKKVALLVAHSAACLPAMRLFLHQDHIQIKSFAMLNPIVHKQSQLNPRWLYEALEWLTFNRLGYRLLQAFNKPIVSYFNQFIKCTDMNVPLLSISTLMSCPQEEYNRLFEGVGKHTSPVLYAFSENDRLNNKAFCWDLLELLGRSKDKCWVYDKDGNLKHKGEVENNFQSACFQAGSHYCFIKHPNEVNNTLLDVLNRSESASGSHS